MKPHDCKKEIEVPEWKGKGEEPSLYILPCLICDRKWSFQPRSCTWGEFEGGDFLNQEEILKATREVLNL